MNIQVKVPASQTPSLVVEILESFNGNLVNMLQHFIDLTRNHLSAFAANSVQGGPAHPKRQRLRKPSKSKIPNNLPSQGFNKTKKTFQLLQSCRTFDLDFTEFSRLEKSFKSNIQSHCIPTISPSDSLSSALIPVNIFSARTSQPGYTMTQWLSNKEWLLVL